MPKMKTHRGAAKRIKARKGGTLKRAKAFTSHILTKKSQKRKRNLRKIGAVSSADIKRIRRALGI